MNESIEPPVSEPPTMPLVELRAQVRPAIASLLVLTLITGGLFPLAVYALGRGLFPAQASGGLIRRRDVIVGATLIGQSFKQAEYFEPRASAAGSGYDATQSGGTNLAPSNPKLVAAITSAADSLRRRNGLSKDAEIPIDAVTTSASGLDPDITPENAALQVHRVARARGASDAAVKKLVAAYTHRRDLLFLGSPRVPVLELNLALDQILPLDQTSPLHPR